MDASDLRAFAGTLGVLTRYVDVDGVERDASDTALRAVCELLAPARPPRDASIDEVVLVRGGRLVAGPRPPYEGRIEVVIELEDGGESVLRAARPAELDLGEVPIGIHRLRWRVEGDVDGESTLLVAPATFPRPGRARPGRTLFAPAYSVWDDDEPLPSYDGLARLGRAVAAAGIDTIATLPLYAPGSGERFESSPYSPLSRFHWNELLVPNRLLGAAAAPDGPAVADRVPWHDIAASRWAQLAEHDAGLGRAGRAGVERFLTDRPDVASYASYAAGGDRRRARLHALGQWLAERALSDVRADFDERGQRLALDLPVGARADSWETATWPQLFSPAASIGAPPDTFFVEGQNWGLPPLVPTASRRDGHRVWCSLLETACRFARVVRIDHVMQVYRLWWIPDGHAADDGVYVRYPADELLAVAAIVAERTGTTMVGENLGTVPPEVSRLLADWGLVGMHEEIFTVHSFADADDGGPGGGSGGEEPGPLPPVPAGTWAGIRTHDMPALAATLETRPTERYRRALAADVGHPVGDSPQEMLAAIVERLESSAALDVVVDLDDVLGATAPHNVPGVVDDRNWTRRIPVPVGALADDPALARVFGEPTGKDGDA